MPLAAGAPAAEVKASREKSSLFNGCDAGLSEIFAEATKDIHMGKKDPAKHGRPSIVLFLKRIWAKVLCLLKNKWTLRIAFGIFRLLVWMAKKFDWF